MYEWQQEHRDHAGGGAGRNALHTLEDNEDERKKRRKTTDGRKQDRGEEDDDREREEGERRRDMKKIETAETRRSDRRFGWRAVGTTAAVVGVA